MMPPPFDALWFRLLAGLVVGLSLGSFVTMLSYRLPRRLSIIKPDSFCPSCSAPLAARDLVPVLSWCLSGGKCRHCKATIGARYPLIELVTGIGAMAAFALIGFQIMLVPVLVVLVAVVTSCVVWIERQK